MKRELLNVQLFKTRKSNLDKAKEKLKTEFSGIDSVIDQVCESISGWYCFNELQNKPLVVNLWGLTGTGKTSLVNRLTTLLELDNIFFKHDMRNTKPKEFGEICDSLHKKFNNEPYVLLLDEFQQGKTIDVNGESSTNEYQIKIWELLDSGRITIDYNFSVVENLIRQIERCNEILDSGCKVQNGVIVTIGQAMKTGLRVKSNRKIRNYFSSNYSEIEKGEDCVQDSYYDDILELSSGRFITETEMGMFLHSLNGHETVEFLNELMITAFKPRNINGTKGLIFVAGNLDDAYHMSSSFSNEADADEFYKESKKISLQDVKQALSELFRKEQISRLGNIHVIYPSLNKQAYESIIAKELSRLSSEFQEMTDIKLCFNRNFLVKIYEEGVIPAQGTRPLFSVIQFMGRAQLPNFMQEFLSKGETINTIIVDYNEKLIKASYLNNGDECFQSQHVFVSNLDLVKERRNKDHRYVVATHEAGHTIACILLLNQIPKRVTSLSSGNDSLGYVQMKGPKTTFKSDVLNWLSVLLAGVVAERLVFGDDHLATGSYGDYAQATTHIVDLIKEGKINEVPGVYVNPGPFSNSYLNGISKHLNTEAEAWLKKANDACKQLLQGHQKALIVLSEKLLEVDCLNMDDLRVFAEVELGCSPPDSEDELHTYAACFEKRKRELTTGSLPELEDSSFHKNRIA